MNLNGCNGTNKGMYGNRTFRAVLNYGNYGQLAEHRCVSDNLEDAIEEANQLVAQHSADEESNCGMLVSPRCLLLLRIRQAAQPTTTRLRALAARPHLWGLFYFEKPQNRACSCSV